MEAGVDTNKARDDGRTPFYAACYQGDVDIVRLLAEAGVDVNVCSQTLARTIECLQRYWLSSTQVAEIEDCGQILTNEQEAARLLLPVLRAQSSRERR